MVNGHRFNGFEVIQLFSEEGLKSPPGLNRAKSSKKREVFGAKWQKRFEQTFIKMKEINFILIIYATLSSKIENIRFVSFANFSHYHRGRVEISCQAGLL